MADHKAEALSKCQQIAGVDEQTNQITLAIEAQVHATLALVEQQRIANLLTLADLSNPRAETQIIADARAALTDYHEHEDPDHGGWPELKPAIKEALGL